MFLFEKMYYILVLHSITDYDNDDVFTTFRSIIMVIEEWKTRIISIIKKVILFNIFIVCLLYQ